jgi:hypothetical protein
MGNLSNGSARPLLRFVNVERDAHPNAVEILQNIHGMWQGALPTQA